LTGPLTRSVDGNSSNFSFSPLVCLLEFVSSTVFDPLQNRTLYNLKNDCSYSNCKISKVMNFWWSSTGFIPEAKEKSTAKRGKLGSKPTERQRQQHHHDHHLRLHGFTHTRSNSSELVEWPSFKLFNDSNTPKQSTNEVHTARFSRHPFVLVSATWSGARPSCCFHGGRLAMRERERSRSQAAQARSLACPNDASHSLGASVTTTQAELFPTNLPAFDYADLAAIRAKVDVKTADELYDSKYVWLGNTVGKMWKSRFSTARIDRLRRA
jgi:hypothetical protein